MANFRKSFNFRNGVQVDNDNLVVNSNGLVGIGTTVPTEALDVRGTAKVVGLVTASDVNTSSINVTGVGTFGTITDGSVTISAGIITAVSGVVTFYGDGVNLLNLPTSQWVDTDVGLGFTSIYAAGNVGVATTDPRNSFQVGGNPNNSEDGVGFSPTGNIRASGIITAATFSGNLAATSLTGTIDNDRLPENISVTGVVTATTFVGSLTGTATTASSLSGTPTITVDDITADNVSATNLTLSGFSTVTTELNVGAGGTAITALNTGRLGIGTASPSTDLQIRKASGTLLDVVADSGQSRISVGQSVGAGNSAGVIRFGNLGKTLDFINNDTGSFRNIIHGGSAGLSTGNFKWIYGQSNAERMTLTWDGNLGLNQASPTHRLHVVGTSTVTGTASFGGNVDVASDLSVLGDVTVTGNVNPGSITLPAILPNTNLNNTTGITTLSGLTATGEVDFQSASFVGMGTQVGVNTDVQNPSFPLSVNGNARVDGVLNVLTGVTLADSVGYVTAFNLTAAGGFRSTNNAANGVTIDYAASPDRIVFSVAGIGSTSLLLV